MTRIRVGVAAILILVSVAAADSAGAARDLTGTCSPVTADPFPDVSASHVHAAGVSCLVEHRITVGRLDGTYQPRARVTRGQMGTFLVRLLETAGKPVPRGPEPRPADEHLGNIHDLLWARVIPDGPADDQPGGAITRAEMVTWMSGAYRFRWDAELIGAPHGETYPFVDVPNDAPYREDALQLWFAEVVAGVTATELDPGGSVTRGQMGSFLARLLDLLLDGPDDFGFAALDPTVQDLVRESATPYGGSVRWTEPIRFWSDGYWTPEAVRTGIGFWNDLLGDHGVSITIVSSEADANVRFRNTNVRPANVPATSCGSEGPLTVTDHVITRGFGDYWLDLEGCTGGDQSMNSGAIGHGMGHVLGLLEHTPGGTDLMASPTCCQEWLSPTLSAYARFIYSTPAGFVPPA